METTNQIELKKFDAFENQELNEALDIMSPMEWSDFIANLQNRLFDNGVISQELMEHLFGLKAFFFLVDAGYIYHQSEIIDAICTMTPEEWIKFLSKIVGFLFEAYLEDSIEPLTHLRDFFTYLEEMMEREDKELQGKETK